MIFKLIRYDDSLGTHCEITLMWIPQNLTNKKSTLVQVMAWCCQAPSHYLSQCWCRFMSTFGMNKLQWVHSFKQKGWHLGDSTFKLYSLEWQHSQNIIKLCFKGLILCLQIHPPGASICQYEIMNITTEWIHSLVDDMCCQVNFGHFKSDLL